MNLTKKRWIVLFASCFINLCIGSMYAWSVFSGPMAKELNVESLAIVFTVANAVGPITMILGGVLATKIKPKYVIMLGGICFGVGMFTSGLAQNTTALIISYGLGIGFGMSFAYGITIGNSVKFFPDKRGMVGGLTTAFYGISSVIIPPIANALNDAVGVRNSFFIFGVAFFVIICGCAFLVQGCPDGFAPDGWTPPANAPGAGKTVNYNWKQMLRQPIFYIMLLMLTCGGVFGLMIISCASAIAQNMIGMTAAKAATIVSVLALFNTAGRIVAGSLSDKIGRINTISIAVVLAIVALVMLYFCSAGTTALFVVAVALLGICFGTFMGVFPGFCTDKFGPKNNTVNYGIMWIGFAIAGIVGPTILTNIYSSTGAYQTAFIIAGCIAAFGLLLTFVYRAMDKKAA